MMLATIILAVIILISKPKMKPMKKKKITTVSFESSDLVRMTVVLNDFLVTIDDKDFIDVKYSTLITNANEAYYSFILIYKEPA